MNTATTTIKVWNSTRVKLRTEAAEQNMPMNRLVDAMVDRAKKDRINLCITLTDPGSKR